MSDPVEMCESCIDGNFADDLNKEIAALRAELDFSKCEYAGLDSECKALREELDALRLKMECNFVGKAIYQLTCAELDALKSQKPVAVVVDNKTEEGGMEWLLMEFDGQHRDLEFGAPLYARPVPAIPDGYVLVKEDSIDISIDSHYIAGMTFGWNCAISEDEKAFQSAINGRVNERAMIAASQKEVK